jgi:hypothetical protein
MVLMQVVKLALHIDTVNMQKDFYVGYHPSFVCLFKNIHGEIEYVTPKKKMF